MLCTTYCSTTVYYFEWKLMKYLQFDETRDFPFYNNNPRISKMGWLILLLCVPISYLAYAIVESYSEIFASIVFCFTMLIPLLYFSNWNYRLMFRKPTRNEIILAFLLFIVYMAYSFIMAIFLEHFNMAGVETTAESMGVTVESTIALVFSMMGEELLKFIPLMFFMRLVYKFTSNRKMALAISVILVLIGFGLMHYNPPYSTLVSVLLIQGLGSLFMMYGYLRTKNIFVPYLSHLFTDAFIFIMILLNP